MGSSPHAQLFIEPVSSALYLEPFAAIAIEEERRGVSGKGVGVVGVSGAGSAAGPPAGRRGGAVGLLFFLTLSPLVYSADANLFFLSPEPLFFEVGTDSDVEPSEPAVRNVPVKAFPAPSNL